MFISDKIGWTELNWTELNWTELNWTEPTKPYLRNSGVRINKLFTMAVFFIRVYTAENTR